MKRKKITIAFCSTGWTTPQPELAPKACTTVLPRRLAGLPACTELTVWRVEQYGRGYVQSAYYCDEHLPAEHRGGGAA